MRRLVLSVLGVGLLAGAATSAHADPAATSTPASASLDVYGGTPSVKGRRTGWFHTERIGKRWWLVDPTETGFS